MRHGKRKKRAADVPVREPAPAVSYRHLPEPVDPDDLVETKDPFPARDPRLGRDTDTEFLLRNAGLL